MCCRETTDGIEMAVLSSSTGSQSGHPAASITPPVQCSSRNSVTEGNSRGARRGMVPADSLELYGDMILRHKNDRHPVTDSLDLSVSRRRRGSGSLRNSINKPHKHG